MVKRMSESKEREEFPAQEMDRIDIEDAHAALREAEAKGTILLRDIMEELGDA
ncbi:MAG: hypothetical protein JWP63_2137 [Candidatus Solibacter sp.]|jgi:hypothetical protein|nr:hypothetical protein [Candidatus Solibacter sp.]